MAGTQIVSPRIVDFKFNALQERIIGMVGGGSDSEFSEIIKNIHERWGGEIGSELCLPRGLDQSKR